ncbi:UDP-glucose 4-epimerase GalE [Paenibacillus oleatilyticus]|uniref:UDP-glucose 4-epimerase n=1 Tax=Paenibacillus oleatilyticus TaxID=2594886 RepID=A0ABV4UZM7_9BACL
MAILVTGGAGYIGSHMVKELLDREEDVIVLDNFQQGHEAAVLGGKLFVGDIRDTSILNKIFENHAIEAVIHFAASALVGESMVNPSKYYSNNLYGTLCLLDAMHQYGVKKIVFSSTAATYGEPVKVPIQETDATIPTNAYGETKLAVEKMLRWYDTAHDIKYIALRYFNASGAHESGLIGEDHEPETHLIPIVLQVALGQRSKIDIYGDDYPTKDGTCIRDYLHVSDLVDAHILALEKLRTGGESKIYNLGNGKGYSVKEIIETARIVTGHQIPAEIKERRNGDPAVLIASSDKIKSELNWTPIRTKLEQIIESAWKWHLNHPMGYRKE